MHKGAWLLLLLMAVYSGGARFFPHIHSDPLTGEQIVCPHGRSAESSSQPDQSSSSCEHCLICQIGETVYLATSASVPMQVTQPLLYSLQTVCVQTPSVPSGSVCSLRGPPVTV